MDLGKLSDTPWGLQGGSKRFPDRLFLHRCCGATTKPNQQLVDKNRASAETNRGIPRSLPWNSRSQALKRTHGMYCLSSVGSYHTCMCPCVCAHACAHMSEWTTIRGTHSSRSLARWLATSLARSHACCGCGMLPTFRGPHSHISTRLSRPKKKPMLWGRIMQTGSYLCAARPYSPGKNSCPNPAGSHKTSSLPSRSRTHRSA